MASDFNENVEQFCLSLKDLESNSKPMITMLTELADEYKEAARELVRTIEDVIYEVAADRKLPYLYLIDSICKHVGPVYITLFAKCLVPLFSHVYAACNDEVKRALVRLRQTWCKVFSNQLLNELDAKIQALDKSWPYDANKLTPPERQCSTANSNQPSRDKRPLDSSTASSGKRKCDVPSDLNNNNQDNNQDKNQDNPPNSSKNNGNSKAASRSGGQLVTSRSNPLSMKPHISENGSVKMKIKLMVTVEESSIEFENRRHKIYHLDETTSIMLKSCSSRSTFNDLKLLRPEDIDPREVHFEGSPVKVYIDERETILLAFDGQWHKFRSAKGFEQYIKFGTPDREIYLNDQIIKARFEGPSVACRLKGDESLHSIRLGGPQPSIRVSEETRFDLWYRFIKKVRTMESSVASTVHN